MEVPLPPRLSWIPAFAGMTVRSDNRIGVDGIIPAFAGMTVRSDNRIGVDGIIPAFAGMTALTLESSFPRRRESMGP